MAWIIGLLIVSGMIIHYNPTLIKEISTSMGKKINIISSNEKTHTLCEDKVKYLIPKNVTLVNANGDWVFPYKTKLWDDFSNKWNDDILIKIKTDLYFRAGSRTGENINYYYSNHKDDNYYYTSQDTFSLYYEETAISKEGIVLGNNLIEIVFVLIPINNTTRQISLRNRFGEDYYDTLKDFKIIDYTIKNCNWLTD